MSKKRPSLHEDINPKNLNKMLPSDTLKDRIFDKAQERISPFAFNSQVATVFPDMIERSVPGYPLILETLAKIAPLYYQEGTKVYDLGCSLGAASLSVHSHLPASAQIVGLDTSEAMLEQAQKSLGTFKNTINIHLKKEDICRFSYEKCSLVILNFTLQFLPVEERTKLLCKIYNALAPGGLLFLSEKIQASSKEADTLFTNLHHDFKRANGYSDLAISQKRSALETVLKPETIDTHLQRLESCGFKAPQPWFQCYNFASFIAFKEA